MITQMTRPFVLRGSRFQEILKRTCSEEIRKPDLIKTGNAKEVFIDSEKFLATGTHLVYKAKNLNKMRLIFFASLGLCSYHTYSYFFGDDQEFDQVSNTLFASLSAITIAWTS